MQRRHPLTVGLVVVPGVLLCSAPMTAQKASPSVAVERTDYDMKRLVAPPALSEPELEGRRLVVQRCAYCHDQGPRAPVPGLDAERIKAVGEAGYRDKILKGSRRMPGWQYALSSAQIDQIMAYVKTVTPSQRSSSAAR